METIKSYLNNIFARLPKTNEILKLKSDLLSNMEDKYNELKSNGKSENEAIGIVISEFGNIDELINEYGIEYGSEEDVLPSLTEDGVNDYLNANKKSGKIIGIGVFLCILAPAMLILINQLVKDGFIGSISEKVGDVVGLSALFFLIAIAVGLFIYSGMVMEKFNYLTKGFELPKHLTTFVQQRKDAFHSTYTLSVIIGVGLCILSPVILFVTPTYGVVSLFIMVAVAVYIFIYHGMINESFNKLLKLDEHSQSSKDEKEESKVVRAVATIVWPLAVCIFLVSGLVFHQWHINWIIFPITALLFSMFGGVYNILKEKNR